MLEDSEAEDFRTYRKSFNQERFTMSILSHNLSGFTVTQDKAGYLNASELCGIAGRQIIAWKVRHETQELIIALAKDLQISANHLIRKEKGIEWIHPELGLSLANWLSPQIAIAVAREIKQTDKLSVEQAMRIADWSTLDIEGITPSVSKVLKLRTFGRLRPDLADAFDPVISAIASANPLPEETYTPTQIGEMLAKEMGLTRISAIRINKKLVAIGFQESVKRINSKGKEVHHYYKPIDKGEEFGQIELAAFRAQEGGSATKPNTRWFAGIVNILLKSWSKEPQNN